MMNCDPATTDALLSLDTALKAAERHKSNLHRKTCAAQAQLVQAEEEESAAERRLIALKRAKRRVRAPLREDFEHRAFREFALVLAKNEYTMMRMCQQQQLRIFEFLGSRTKLFRVDRAWSEAFSVYVRKVTSYISLSQPLTGVPLGEHELHGLFHRDEDTDVYWRCHDDQRLGGLRLVLSAGGYWELQRFWSISSNATLFARATSPGGATPLHTKWQKYLGSDHGIDQWHSRPEWAVEPTPAVPPAVWLVSSEYPSCFAGRYDFHGYRNGAPHYRSELRQGSIFRNYDGGWRVGPDEGERRVYMSMKWGAPSPTDVVSWRRYGDIGTGKAWHHASGVSVRCIPPAVAPDVLVLRGTPGAHVVTFGRFTGIYRRVRPESYYLSTHTFHGQHLCLHQCCGWWFLCAECDREKRGAWLRSSTFGVSDVRLVRWTAHTASLGWHVPVDDLRFESPSAGDDKVSASLTVRFPDRSFRRRCLFTAALVWQRLLGDEPTAGGLSLFLEPSVASNTSLWCGVTGEYQRRDNDHLGFPCFVHRSLNTAIFRCGQGFWCIGRVSDVEDNACWLRSEGNTATRVDECYVWGYYSPRAYRWLPDRQAHMDITLA